MASIDTDKVLINVSYDAGDRENGNVELKEDKSNAQHTIQQSLGSMYKAKRVSIKEDGEQLPTQLSFSAPSGSQKFKWAKTKEPASVEKRDPPRNNWLLFMWDELFHSIPRRWHFLIWYPILIGIGLATVIPWFQSTQQLANAQFNNKFDIVVSPTNNLTYTNLNNAQINSTINGKSANGITATCTLSGLDPISLTVSVDCSFDLVGVMSSAEYDDDESEDSMFYLSPDNMNTYTGRSWSSVDDYWLNVMVQREPTLVNDTLAWGFIPAAKKVSVDLTPVKSVIFYPFDSYSATFEIQSRLYITGQFTLPAPPPPNLPPPLAPSDYAPSENAARTSRAPEAALMTSSFPVDCFTTFSATTISGFNLDYRGTASTRPPFERNGEWIRGYTTTTVTISMSRNREVQGLAVFVSVLFWLIGLGILAEALDYVIVRPSVCKQDDGTRAGLAAVFLFALPALRSVQSGIPGMELYCSMDVASFYVSMGMTAVATILHLGHMTWAPKSH